MVMPTIRIDSEVIEALRKQAVPFEDTPNSVLRRILGLDERRKPEQQLRNGQRAPIDSYRRPILQALVDLGGEGPTGRVLNRVGELMKSTLRSADYEETSSGEPRWRNRARWHRLRMVEEGLIKPNSPHGWWVISEKGRSLLGRS
ncbi:MAG: winged helix-turn-helix domain-containing protein [Candidatus Binatia bacterium]